MIKRIFIVLLVITTLFFAVPVTAEDISLPSDFEKVTSVNEDHTVAKYVIVGEATVAVVSTLVPAGVEIIKLDPQKYVDILEEQLKTAKDDVYWGKEFVKDSHQGFNRMLVHVDDYPEKDLQDIKREVEEDYENLAMNESRVISITNDIKQAKDLINKWESIQENALIVAGIVITTISATAVGYVFYSVAKGDIRKNPKICDGLDQTYAWYDYP